jgi:prevent-host-death family protein
MPAPEADQTISTTAARDRFADILNRAAYGKERVVLTRRGRPLVAVVPIEDVELLERLGDERDAQEAREALAELEAVPESAASLEEFARKHGIEP